MKYEKIKKGDITFDIAAGSCGLDVHERQLPLLL